MPDRIAEHEQPRALGLPCQHRQPHDHGRRHAGRGLVVLVEHDVEAELVGEQPFVVVTVEQIGRDVRVAFAVRQVDAQRALVVLPRVGIGLLGEMVHSHRDVPSTKAKMRSANRLGLLQVWKMPGALDQLETRCRGWRRSRRARNAPTRCGRPRPRAARSERGYDAGGCAVSDRACRATRRNAPSLPGCGTRPGLAASGIAL